MEKTTTEQAAEAAKGLTFEKVWAALIDTRKLIADIQRETQKLFQESQKQIRESQQETQKQLQESKKQMQESQQKTDKILADLSKNISGLGNSLGWYPETMFSSVLWNKFSDLGYSFTKQGPHVKFIENGQVVAEADFLLENSEYAMPVEIKTELSNEDVDEHLERIAKIRKYMDVRRDKRKLIGAVAGGVIFENVLKYAYKKGLYVIIQAGENVAIAASPQGFKARVW